jgi:D-alanyl-D-alanine carboxypeptidase
VSGTSWSAHAWAAAVDTNPEQNPFSSAGVLKTNMPREFRAAFKDHGWGWGGDWDSVKDAMHFSMDKGEGGDALKQAYNRDLQEEADDKWGGRPPDHDKHFGIEPAPPWRHEHPGNVDNPHMNCDTVGHWQKQTKRRSGLSRSTATTAIALSRCVGPSSARSVCTSTGSLAQKPGGRHGRHPSPDITSKWERSFATRRLSRVL